VRSSTSSSSDRIPDLRLGRVWVVVLGLITAGFVAWEVVLRATGFPPEVSPTAWSIARARAAEGVPVIVGSSRIQAALDLDAWVEARGGPTPAQLAMAGGPALPMLEDLAEDDRVDGFVLVDALAFHTFDASGNSGASVPQRMAEYDRFERSPATRLETFLRVGVSSLMAWRSPAAAPSAVWASLRRGEGLPVAPQSALRRDRFRPIDFVSSLEGRDWTPEDGFMVGEDMRFAREFGEAATAAGVAAIIERLEAAAQRIRTRGGDVVFLTMPACGPRLAIEEDRYPRAAYWDRLAEGVSFRTLNAADEPELVGFSCYDGSHLDRADAAVFTKRLVDLLFSNG